MGMVRRSSRSFAQTYQGAAVPLCATLLLAWCAFALEEKPPLELAAKVGLAEVHGRIDHLAADIYQARLFVAALGDDSVQVLDVRNNALLSSIPGIPEPQGIAYLKAANRLFVTSAGDGSVRMFDASTFKLLTNLHLGMNADNIRVDAAHDRVYIGYGEGALAVLDISGKKLADIALKAHPESFQVSEQAPRIFVNVPETQSIVVIDSNSFQIIAEWPLSEAQDNFPMALDEANHRIFVASRRPSRLLVLDMDSGRTLAHLPTVGDADDLFYDPIHSRVYVIGGQGRIAVYAQQAPDRYLMLDPVPTVAGARTGLFVPEWNRLFVAVRDLGAHPAEIRVYQPH